MKVQMSRQATKQVEQGIEPRRMGVAIPYVAGLDEKMQRILKQHKIPVYFKQFNALKQKLFFYSVSGIKCHRR